MEETAPDTSVLMRRSNQCVDRTDLKVQPALKEAPQLSADPCGNELRHNCKVIKFFADRPCCMPNRTILDEAIEHIINEHGSDVGDVNDLRFLAGMRDCVLAGRVMLLGELSYLSKICAEIVEAGAP
jgi:hypothetical protein